jgi:soluble lytic murein transglycosylase-like protein
VARPLLGALLLVGSRALAGAPLEHQYDDAIRAAVADVRSVYPVPAELVRAVIKQESAFDAKAVSRCGAVGLMQLMPFNATKLGLSDEKQLWTPALNILAGVRLLAALLRHYDGDVIAALVAYNSGPKRKLSPVPSNGETPDYVVRILRAWREYESAASSSAAPLPPSVRASESREARSAR